MLDSTVFWLDSCNLTVRLLSLMWTARVYLAMLDSMVASVDLAVVVWQERQEEAIALEKAGRIICNVKLAAAWRGWLAVVQHRRYLKEKLGSALNLFTNRRLTLAWQAWQVSLHTLTCLYPCQACQVSFLKFSCLCKLSRFRKRVDSEC